MVGQDMDLVYITKFPESVFWSQVFELLRTLPAAAGDTIRRRVLLAGLDGTAQEASVAELRKRCASEGIELFTFRYWPLYPLGVGRTVRSLKSALESLEIDDARSVFHVRDEMNASLLWRAGFRDPSRTLVDVRAANPEELDLYGRGLAPLRMLKGRIKRTARRELARYRWINVVSRELGAYVRAHAGDGQETEASSAPFLAVPCLAGPDFCFDPDVRARMRSELALGDDDVLSVFSSASDSGWQRTEQIVESLAALGTPVLNLSKTALDMPGVINRFVEYHEMPAYLMAADVAVLWRDDNVVNHVASPVKFSEYVCCGLPVILNGAVRGARDYVTETGAGQVIEALGEIAPEMLRRVAREADRAANAARASLVYGMEVGCAAYVGAYESMLTESGGVAS
jgi:hypothetical protein